MVRMLTLLCIGARVLADRIFNAQLPDHVEGIEVLRAGHLLQRAEYPRRPYPR